MPNREAKLVVEPQWAISPLGHAIFVVVVRNNFPHAVTVTEVGFNLPGNQIARALTGVSSGGFLPQRLEPGASLAVPQPTETEHMPTLQKAGRAYAKTDDGVTHTGTIRARDVLLQPPATDGS